jgi:hypothetical protein
MKHERPANYPHYRRNKNPEVTREAIELAMHFGADPKAIQKSLDQLKQNPPTQSQRTNLN